MRWYRSRCRRRVSTGRPLWSRPGRSLPSHLRRGSGQRLLEIVKGDRATHKDALNGIEGVVRLCAEQIIEQVALQGLPGVVGERGADAVANIAPVGADRGSADGVGCVGKKPGAIGGLSKMRQSPVVPFSASSNVTAVAFTGQTTRTKPIRVARAQNGRNINTGR